MIRRLHFLTIAARRRVVLWMLGSLILAGLTVGIVDRVLWPVVELHAAEQALRCDDPVGARACLDRYLARWPRDQQALFLAAQAARQSDAYADAEQLLTTFEQTSGPTDASQLEWVLLGARQGDFAGKDTRLRTAVAHRHPDASAIVVALAKGYMASYRRADALVVLSEFLERSATDVPALVLRGTVWDSLHQTDAAAADFRRAVELAPDNAAAQGALAGLLNRSGHTREAIYHYQLAQRSRPADPAIRLGLARAYTDAAELNDAQRQLDELLNAAPEHVDGLVERGRLALRRSRYAEAEPFLARAVGAAPWHREGQQLHLIALRELGRTKEASQVEARLAELTAEDAIGGRLRLRARDAPGDLGVRLELWDWSLRNGDVEDGLAWLFEILRLDPGHAQAHAALAQYFDGAGQPRRAALHHAAAADS